jgi:hypothetical protein
MLQEMDHCIARAGPADAGASSTHLIRIGKALPACICRVIAVPSKVTIHGAFSIHK